MIITDFSNWETLKSVKSKRPHIYAVWVPMRSAPHILELSYRIKHKQTIWYLPEVELDHQLTKSK
jgi:hypothetical protein